MKQLFRIWGRTGVDNIVAVPAISTGSDDKGMGSRWHITRLVGETGEQVVLDYLLKSEAVTECFASEDGFPERTEEGTILLKFPTRGSYEIKLPADFPPEFLGYIRMAYFGGVADGRDFDGSIYDVKPHWKA